MPARLAAFFGLGLGSMPVVFWHLMSKYPDSALSSSMALAYRLARKAERSAAQ